MRIRFDLAAALTIAALAVYGSPARAADLTGKMVPFSYLVGTSWSCTTSVPAMMGMAAHTDQATATFEVGPRNVVHSHVQGAEYSADSYFGYSDRFSNFWQTSADNMGSHSFLTSTDGKIYTGTSSMGTMSADDTTSYSKVAENKITVHEVISGGPLAGTFDTVCTK
jgi:hypothetical protein